MYIRYVHCSAPKVEEIHDTVKARQRNLGLIKLSQEEFDAFTLRRFEEELAAGIVRSYSVVPEAM